MKVDGATTFRVKSLLSPVASIVGAMRTFIDHQGHTQ